MGEEYIHFRHQVRTSVGHGYFIGFVTCKCFGLELRRIICFYSIMQPLALKTHPYTADSTYSQRQVNTLRPGQNGRHFTDDIFKCIFLNENVWILVKISLKFVPKGLINNIPALVQIMAWRRPGDKPLSEPMMVRLYIRIYASLGLNELKPPPL